MKSAETEETRRVTWYRSYDGGAAQLPEHRCQYRSSLSSHLRRTVQSRADYEPQVAHPCCRRDAETVTPAAAKPCGLHSYMEWKETVTV
ncbi:hypothetical protein FKM82_029217 [Ascaphus truei]